MTRALILLATLAPLASHASEGTAPERLAPRTSVLYFRWDGYTPHKAAYDRSAAGAMLNDRYGAWLADVGLYLEKLGLDALLGENPILEGRSPKEVLERVKNRQQFMALKTILRDHGVMICADVKTSALTRLLSSLAATPDAFSFDMRVVVPGAAEHRELFETVIASMIEASLRGDEKSGGRVDTELAGRKISTWQTPALPIQLWCEGKDAMLRVGTGSLEKVFATLDADCEGLAGTSRYKRMMAEAKFTVTTRLMIDPARIISISAKPGEALPKLLEPLRGLDGIDYAGGFDGKLSRYQVDFAADDTQTSFASAFVAKPIAIAELPPLPPRVSRWNAIRFDPAKLEGWVFGLGDANFRDEARDALKFDIKRDLVPLLGDTLVSFVDEAEGKAFGFSLGHTFMIRVNDDQAARKAVKELSGGIGTLFQSGNIAFTDKGRPFFTISAGRELRAAGVGASFAVHRGWLIISASKNSLKATLDRLDDKNAKTWADRRRNAATRIDSSGADSFWGAMVRPLTDVLRTSRRNLAFFGSRNFALERSQDTKSLPIFDGIGPDVRLHRTNTCSRT